MNKVTVRPCLDARLAVAVAVLVAGVAGQQHNFCRPLEDYGPRYDAMEERRVCATHFQKSCQPVRTSDCMNVTELACEVCRVLCSDLQSMSSFRLSCSPPAA